MNQVSHTFELIILPECVIMCCSRPHQVRIKGRIIVCLLRSHKSLQIVSRNNLFPLWEGKAENHRVFTTEIFRKPIQLGYKSVQFRYRWKINLTREIQILILNSWVKTALRSSSPSNKSQVITLPMLSKSVTNHEQIIILLICKNQKTTVSRHSAKWPIGD